VCLVGVDLGLINKIIKAVVDLWILRIKFLDEASIKEEKLVSFRQFDSQETAFSGIWKL